MVLSDLRSYQKQWKILIKIITSDLLTLVTYNQRTCAAIDFITNSSRHTITNWVPKYKAPFHLLNLNNYMYLHIIKHNFNKYISGCPSYFRNAALWQYYKVEQFHRILCNLIRISIQYPHTCDSLRNAYWAFLKVTVLTTIDFVLLLFTEKITNVRMFVRTLIIYYIWKIIFCLEQCTCTSHHVKQWTPNIAQQHLIKAFVYHQTMGETFRLGSIAYWWSCLYWCFLSNVSLSVNLCWIFVQLYIWLSVPCFNFLFFISF